MINELLRQYQATLTTLPPIPEFYKKPHLLMETAEPYKYLLLVDLWFYSQLKQSSYTDLLLDTSLPAKINHHFGQVNRTHQKEEYEQLLNLDRNLKHNVEHNFIEPINQMIEQRQNALTAANPSTKIRLESELAKIKRNLDPIISLRDQIQIRIGGLENLMNGILNQPTVSNRFFLKTFLKPLDPECLFLQIPEAVEEDVLPVMRQLTPNAERMKKYVSDMLKSIFRNNLTENVHLFGLAILNTNPMQVTGKTLGINFKTYQILDPENGIISLSGMDNLANFFIDLIKLKARQDDSDMWGVQLDLFYQLDKQSKQKTEFNFPPEWSFKTEGKASSS